MSNLEETLAANGATRPALVEFGSQGSGIMVQRNKRPLHSLALGSGDNSLVGCDSSSHHQTHLALGSFFCLGTKANSVMIHHGKWFDQGHHCEIPAKFPGATLSPTKQLSETN